MKLDPNATPDFQALFEGAPSLYLVLDPDFKIVAVSDTYCRATMTSRDGILGFGIFDIFPDNPADTKATGVSNLRLSLDRVLQFRRPDAMAIQKYDIPRPNSEDGGFEERYWSPLNTPVLNGNGELAWVIHRVEDVTELVKLQAQGAVSNKLQQEQLSTIAQLGDANQMLAQRNEENAKLQQKLVEQSIELQNEIAERKKTEESLKSANAFHNLVIENIPAMVFVKDAKDHRFIFVNRAGENMMGINRSELLGKNDYDFFPKEQADFFIARDNEVLASGTLQVTAEEPITTQHNGIRLLQTMKIPVSDENGKNQYLVALSEDITERKSVEKQLRQAQKMEAIGNLTGGMAHDFNNLLSVIIGNLDLLRGRLKGGAVVDPETDQLSSEALDAALKGADLTQRLLAFARRQPLQPQRININELVARISKLVDRMLGEDIKIRLDLGADVWPVVADPAQLEAGLVNIFNNARDAMPRGGVLTIATGNRNLDDDYTALHPGLAPGNYTMIEVSDTGTGIPPEVLSHIFEPFFTTKEQSKGTGLGLSMVFGFMKQSGGHINVHSEAGHGTTFRLYLPRATSAVEAVATRAAALERSGHETVLAVEDNAGLRRVVRRQLDALGYRVLEAEDGAAALKILESDAVDLLFTDIVMPGGLSGYDLARTVVARWPAMKVLLTSGFPEAKLDGNGGTRINMRLLTKPYRKGDLARVLREILDAN